MGRNKFNQYLKESGLSLVEVLASIVILTLLLTTFLMMFLQSAKVNKASERVIDATYIAQVEMENIYALSTVTKYKVREEAITGQGYVKELDEDGWTVFKRTHDSDVSIKLKLLTKKVGITRVMVEVHGTPDDNLQAQMENVIIWEAD